MMPYLKEKEKEKKTFHLFAMKLNRVTIIYVKKFSKLPAEL
jgi:phage regulator Rha-like protein